MSYFVIVFKGNTANRGWYKHLSRGAFYFILIVGVGAGGSVRRNGPPWWALLYHNVLEVMASFSKAGCVAYCSCNRRILALVPLKRTGKHKRGAGGNRHQPAYSSCDRGVNRFTGVTDTA